VYQWFVFTHVAGLVLFVFAHGFSGFAAFRIRTLRDAHRIADELARSQVATRVMFLGLLLLAIGGIGAASTANLWGQAWITASIVVFVIVFIAMYAVGAAYYYKLRDLVAGKGGVAPIEGDALANYLDSRRPELLLLIGGIGLVVLIWLMVLKPV
jgi:hypothetical protein